MADQDSERRPAAGGSGFSRRVAGAPLWVWAVGLGTVAGVVWVFRRRSASVNASQAAAGASSTGDQAQTSIIPSDMPYGGLGEAQFEQLLAAIQSLQGPASTPVTTLPGPGRPVIAPPSQIYHPRPHVGPAMSAETAVAHHP